MVKPPGMAMPGTAWCNAGDKLSKRVIGFFQIYTFRNPKINTDFPLFFAGCKLSFVYRSLAFYRCIDYVLIRNVIPCKYVTKKDFLNRRDEVIARRLLPLR